MKGRTKQKKTMAMTMMVKMKMVGGRVLRAAPGYEDNVRRGLLKIKCAVVLVCVLV